MTEDEKLDFTPNPEPTSPSGQEPLELPAEVEPRETIVVAYNLTRDGVEYRRGEVAEVPVRVARELIQAGRARKKEEG